MNKNRNNEIKLTIRNTVVAVLVIVFFCGIILLYHSMLYSEKKDSIIKSGELIAKESAEEIDHYLSTNIDSIKLAAYALDGMIKEHRTDDEIQDYLVGQSTAVRSAVIENMTGLYGYINGRFFSGTNWVPPSDYVATARPWYTKPMESPGEITILDPYVDVQSGNVMLALGKTLCDGVSVISVDVSLDQIQKLTEDAVFSGNSDVEMLLNDKGMVVAHSDRNEIGKNYYEEDGTFGAEIAKKLDRVGSYSFEFVFEGSNYIVYVADIRNGWLCISVKDATSVFGSLNSILFITITAVVAIVVVIGIIMTRSNRYLHMSTRAMAANEAKSEFLSNMSHEIRTPINAMLGMNEMILRESDDPTVLNYSENVKSAGKNLLGLISNVLDFSKIEAGRMEIVPMDYDLSSLLTEIENLIETRAENKRLLFVINADRNIPKHLHGDEMRIKQIMTNLLTNAVKYTEKGSVTFTIGYDTVENDPDSVIIKVSVKDTGIGIRDEDRDKLFLEFERLDTGRNNSIEGTGLGMSITKRLLELMGSTLTVESVYGEGSEFGFALKQGVVSPEVLGDYKSSRKTEHAEKEKSHEKFIAPDARVLVVDDNEMNIKVFISLIKRTQVMADSAGSADEGIDLTLSTKYDMIFMDHMMPEKDGIEALHEIRENPDNPNNTTPTVCLTANAISGARETYLSAGFDDYLTKPVDPDTLEEMMLYFLPEEKTKRRGEDSEESPAEEENKDSDIMSEIFEKLLDSPIDAFVGLKNSGTAEAYLSLLQIFRGSIDEKAEELNRLYGDEDFKNYTIKVHALKSSARIIGAVDFGEEAQKLENAGKEGDNDYIFAHHEQFIDEYLGFKEPLSVVISGAAKTPGKEDAPDDMMEGVFEEIKAGALDMDCEMLDGIFEEMDNYNIPHSYAELYGKLHDALLKYDYKGMVRLLSQDKT